MLEPDGRIAKTTMRDYVHPTPHGFERLSRALSPLLEPLLAAPVAGPGINVAAPDGP